MAVAEPTLVARLIGPPRHPAQARPQALDAREQRRFLRAVEMRRPARDRAIGRGLFHSGLRVAELVALDLDDVPLSARKGEVIVRNGKDETSREVPLLDVTVREAVKEWKAERSEWPGAAGPALFLNRSRGGRLSAPAVDQLLDELATEADLVNKTGAHAASGRLPATDRAVQRRGDHDRVGQGADRCSNEPRQPTSPAPT
ncbi:tyrosine-type recombinase/integrase [Nonomuraea rubra]|uniref:Site-specific recombinase XerC n=1 Tax=Nonomuraea rubra TaxID=46180 RepID=A0A7X0P4K1_9ACTN|nr:tyrosine-type recombinase/integrase [Nonomuraea rubra]MBB6555161.1 site-specific recombinase XerC [Nonomuraea rubra]